MAIKRVIVKGMPLRDEDVADAAITPGHLVEKTATGVAVHSTAAGNQNRMFAVERDFYGGGIDDAYATSDTVLLATCRNGDVVNALVAAAATAITRGAALESAGDGTVRIASTDAATDDTQRESVVGYAEEAVDNSMGGSAVRILVRIA